MNCLSVLCFCLSLYLSLCLSVSVSVPVSVCLSVCLSLCLCLCLCLSLSLSLSLSLQICFDFSSMPSYFTRCLAESIFSFYALEECLSYCMTWSTKKNNTFCLSIALSICFSLPVSACPSDLPWGNRRPEGSVGSASDGNGVRF